MLTTGDCAYGLGGGDKGEICAPSAQFCRGLKTTQKKILKKKKPTYSKLKALSTRNHITILITVKNLFNQSGTLKMFFKCLVVICRTII